jgi:hypothetical protein
MWLGVGILLLIVWGVAFLVFKVAAWAIHLLIVAALIAGAIHVYEAVKKRHAS